MSQVFISGSNSLSFRCLDAQVTSTWGNVVEKIALIEPDQMGVLWSSRKPFPKELLGRDQEEMQDRKGGAGSYASKGIPLCHPVPTAF